MSALEWGDIPGQLDLLEAARTARDDSINQVEAHVDDWQRDAIDELIRLFAWRGIQFSANDIRPLLPDGIRPALVGARFLNASRTKQIRKVGYTPSTDKATHAHVVALWLGT